MNKQILRLAIPNIISNLSVPLLSSIDTALMGRQGSEAHIGALSISALIFNFIYYCFSFLRMGTTGLTAQNLGKKDQTAIINILVKALVMAFISGCILIILQTPLSELSFSLMSMSSDVEPLAHAYYDIRIWEAPATLMLYAISGWFFGIHNTIFPMILTIIASIINIISSMYFIYSFDMNIEGVALGTVIAHYVTVFIALAFLIIKHRDRFAHFQYKVLIETKSFLAFLKFNKNIFIRSLVLMSAFLFFKNQSSTQGDLILAVNGILLQFIMWVSFGIDGFSYTVGSLVGKYVGANNLIKVKKAINLCFFWAMSISAGYSLCYWLFGDYLLSFFTDQTHVIEKAKLFIPWLVLFPIISTPCYIWDGIYIGYVASRELRNNMFISIIVYLAFFYGEAYFIGYGNHALWLSIIVFNAFRGFIQWFVFKNKIAS